MPIQKLTTYQKVTAICEEYLGPAGERFIRRQIKTHLNIEPEEITKSNLNELANWASLTFAVLTNNADEVDEFAKKLSSIAREKG